MKEIPLGNPASFNVGGSIYYGRVVRIKDAKSHDGVIYTLECYQFRNQYQRACEVVNEARVVSAVDALTLL